MEAAVRRAAALRAAWPADESAFDPADVSVLRELFGPTFLTPDYYLPTFVVIDEKG